MVLGEMPGPRAMHAIPWVMGWAARFEDERSDTSCHQEQGRSAVQQSVPLAGASMSKVLKLVIFSAVPSAVQACSSPTPILIKFIGSNYELG